MKKTLLFTSLMCAGLSMSALAAAPALMPYPAKLSQQQGYFSLPATIGFSVSQMGDARLALLKQQLQQSLNTQLVDNNHAASLQIHVKQSANADYPALGDDESYSLKINSQGIRIDAATELGALRAAQTLRQLAFEHQGKLPFVSIEDSPRFPWRGLMIDSARHFMPLDAIYRQLDGMASAKLNVFHWHLTDDQGWRLESKTYPKLQELASDGLYYTQDDIRKVVDYARQLGIRVVPEFDVPGHASAIATAYPELISQPGPYQLERHWGVFEPLLDPSNPKVYAFIDAMVGEIASLFPDPYLHIGGDEINPKQWQQSESVAAYMTEHKLADHHELHTHFNAKVQKILARHGKKMMGWDEIFHPDLPKDIMIQSWQGLDSLAQTAMAGYQGLLSTGFYIDQPQKTAYHYRNEPIPANDFVVPKISNDTQWQQWQFEMPRLKGSAVKGEFVIFTQADGSRQGYIQVNKQQTRMLNDIETLGSLTRFWLDTWMGPMQFEVSLNSTENIDGRILIGNSPYTVRGKQLGSGQGNNNAPQVVKPTYFEPQSADNILGGEATIWSEIITGDNLDLRIWPRLYAIAERFWSAKTLTDKDEMYRRLAVMHEYGTKVGLAYADQQQAGFASLVSKGTDLSPLYTLAEIVEQAQYYTRHHIKFQADAYHHGERLDRFVDFLPAESLALVALDSTISQIKPTDKTALTKVDETLSTWQQQLPAMRELVNANSELLPLAPVVADIEQTLQLSRQLVANCRNKAISQAEGETLRNQLWQLAEVRQEMVIGLAYSAERLLERCSN
ncbi:family 20 glycosylhydrolase [Bowmanella sp. Y26]|uniref:family 20 glycosylhydrolase n=1 Tax=Bowmanella yangjiangensis TaxID=2811230 RepID=UPI001BDDAF4E|nr:family 20 glycosylhydrolase [Bowmanella yangjiangensis]MBT1063556.1 family 20 glycosylhydrolase [Bowmanella yangjiangensis]